MQLKTSFFNPTIFRKNLTRFWPMWAVYGLFWFLVMPAILFQQLRSGYGIQYLAQHVTSSAAAGVAVAFVYSVLCAMALFSYLFQGRSAVAMHAFPLRRECLFFTNYVSGLVFTALPLAFNFCCTLLVGLMGGQACLGVLLVWFTAQLCYTLFFFSFAVFCAMFTGHQLALPAFYGILSVLPVVLYYLLNEVLGLFVFGYNSSYTMEETATALSPVVKLLQEVGPQVRQLPGETLYYISGWGWILLYAFVGLLLTAAALLVYRRRQVESAGDVVSVRAVRPLFLYGVSICASLSLGLLLFAIFGNNYRQGTAAWQLLVYLLIAGFLGYFAAQMLLNKTLRVWRGHWKGFAAFAAAVAVLVTAMEFDLFGFERAIPEAGQVNYVMLHAGVPPYDNNSFSYREPEKIRMALELNRYIIEHREEIQQVNDEQYSGTTIEPVRLEDGSLYYPETEWVYLDVLYGLKNGATESRTYRLVMREEALADPDSLESRLQAVLNGAQREADYFGDDCTEERLSTADVNIYDDEGDWKELSGSQARMLFRAVQEDLDAGRIGNVWVVQGREYQALQMNVDLNFTFRWQSETGEPLYSNYQISPNRGSTATLAALRQLGLSVD